MLGDAVFSGMSQGRKDTGPEASNSGCGTGARGPAATTHAGVQRGPGTQSGDRQGAAASRPSPVWPARAACPPQTSAAPDRLPCDLL